MKTNFKTQEMTEQEIREGLKLFKKYLKKISYTHADPIEQNAYTSSSCIIGVYFPNTQFTTPNHRSYDLASVSKVDGVLGVVFSKKDDLPNDALSRDLPDFIFEDLDGLLYPYTMRKIRGRMQDNLKHYTRVYEALCNIKQVKRKNGEQFAQVLKNFESPLALSFNYTFFDAKINAVKIGYDTLTMYRADEKVNSEPISVEEVLEIIARYKTQYEGYIEREKAELRNLERNYSKYEKVAQELSKLRGATSHYYTFEENLRDMMRD